MKSFSINHKKSLVKHLKNLGDEAKIFQGGLRAMGGREGESGQVDFDGRIFLNNKESSGAEVQLAG